MFQTIRFVVVKIAAAAVLLIAVTFLTFALLTMVPDPSRQLLGRTATVEQLAAKREELGLNDPLWSRYLEWFGNAITGDFGTSWYTGLPVTDTIAGVLPVTLSLAIVSTLVSAILGVAIGITAAFRGGWIDKALQVLASVGFAIPAMWFALILVIVFAVNIRLFPATGYVPLTENPAEWLRSLFLPVAAITLGSLATIATQVRSDIETLLWQDWYRTLRSRGLPTSRLLFVNLLRNAAPRTLTIIGLQFISTLGGAIIIEQIFGMRGLGSVAVGSTLKSDIPVILAVAVVATAIVLIINALVDIASGWLNPKERTSR